ncbi:bifunctional protein tyrosine phosphatase family protein/NAD(P)/FAD-dependent oxidoreductase [Pandoraea anhela]|uniref:Beta-lactamase hydrolase-like protein n=1 Tax=Pandoraea anhela TaxID=2508295 RepID=A0A5E4WCH5_9BURK|nr:bifunctional protein tyrosine phosphatase family protein/NAD(P)/FAD-dependent oxidoreductase [Pandoraea anhela]VVE21080.1 Beta-lactamase hydrolase-like protein [Pandoraea anhela]
MQLIRLSANVLATALLSPADLPSVSVAGCRAIIYLSTPNARDPRATRDILAAADRFGIHFDHIPLDGPVAHSAEIAQLRASMARINGPVLLWSHSLSQCIEAWAFAAAHDQPPIEILETAAAAGHCVAHHIRRIALGSRRRHLASAKRHTVVIVGAGAAGIATAASLLAREPALDIALIDPCATHYYQPGWTLVGAGVFSQAKTARDMAGVLPPDVKWIKAEVVGFEPSSRHVVLSGGDIVGYERLVVCPGLKLNWSAIAGLKEALGSHGVTSNYRYDLAPYTWQLVTQLKRGRAIFTQPSMPIKCAGAPQKAMYLSADHWRRAGHQDAIDIQMFNAGTALFGVADYVPALMQYVERYDIDLNFGTQLTAVDAAHKTATFRQTLEDGSQRTVTTEFDMMHVVPPQAPPDFIRFSPLADGAGWVDVDPSTLQHKTYANVFALGDVTNTPNAKTAAAARKQAPVVAHNVLHSLAKRESVAIYNGYGSCPLTVERGKIVLAEFLYGGKLAPTFPSWLINGKRPSRLAWHLKESALPYVYWQAMLKGKEWFAKPMTGIAALRPVD